MHSYAASARGVSPTNTLNDTDVVVHTGSGSDGGDDGDDGGDGEAGEAEALPK